MQEKENTSADIVKRDEIIMNYIKELVPNFADYLRNLNPTDEYPFDLPEIQALCMSKDPINQSSLAPLEGLLIRTLDERRKVHESLEYRLVYTVQRNVLKEIYEHSSRLVKPFHKMNATYPRLAEIYLITKRLGLIDYSKTAEDALSVPFNDVVNLWQKDVNSKLIQLIRDACGPEYVFNPDIVLGLATTFFTCNCRSPKEPFPLRYNQAICHRCNPFDLDSRNDPAMRERYHIFGHTIWEAENVQEIDRFVRFDKNHLDIMQGVVKMCALDPKVAKMDDMDTLNPVFECIACSSPRRGRALMTWVAVLEHQCTLHQSSTDISSIRVVREDAAQKARIFIKKKEERATCKSSKCKFYCSYCNYVVQGFKTYQIHSKQIHKISEVKYEDLVYPLQENRIPPMCMCRFK
ncbi:hypothetical protein BDN70DRAFT_300099 [Pholiota conissans]|uniref:C2H2-type domain-containing protein n=1 Tax=Pholiota conissans TaxID=109636 RepID=A0A9P5YVI6_9AGAR|nr:hypothetical protein BDN70DRAFT_300099 [Pholiota conissans]